MTSNASSAPREKSPLLAAIFSFIITGMGQIYNGDIKMAFILFGAQVLVLGFLGLLLGRIALFITFVIWVYGIYDAYTTAQAIINTAITEDWTRP